MKRQLTAALTVALVAAAVPAVRSTEGASRVEVLKTGKEKFEQTCKFCHSLERSLARNKSREEWSLTVKRMVTYGAPLNSAQRESVTAYLSAKSAFETNCNACHSNLRVLSRPIGDGDWKETIERMGGHLKDVAGKEGGAKELSAEEVEDIAAFLTIVIPKD